MDILDDLFTPALELAEELKDLTADADDFLGSDLSSRLVGLDPGAIGRHHRFQRSSGLGIKQGTHLFKNGMPMLIPDKPPRIHADA